MPTVMIRTNVSLSERQHDDLFSSITDVMIEAAHKKHEKVMVLLEKVEARMGMKDDPLVFAEVRSMVGLDHKMNHDLSVRFTEVFERVLGTSSDRMYMNFVRIPETAWGWKGGISIWNAVSEEWIVR
ncbi:MAG: tautomerase family protein [Deltaproteobacteria bacterium]|nr:tautomerase family protein [Deltaproteobacteria bacterium]